MKPVLVCLHGWGGSKESFTELRAALKGTDVQILTPDLPGFGEEPEPKKPWTVDDYADWVEKWITKHTSSPVLLLGHSHGGRIALKLASRQAQGRGKVRIEHLYLCAAAGIRHPRHFKRILGLTLAKGGKAVLSVPGLKTLAPIGKKFLYKLVRVHDYEKASPVMQQTLIKVSAEDLRPVLRTVKIPTDLFWGKQDGMTPFGDALIMEKEIPDVTLHAYDGVRHAVHRDRALDIARVLQSRIA
jgi:pimeloyl-ACP methyl ester carboxylesterase